MEAIVKVINKGAEKYDANGWLKGVKFDPKSNAASKSRHNYAASFGVLKDEETGLFHAEHEATRAVMGLHCTKHGLAGFSSRSTNVFDEQNI